MHVVTRKTSFKISSNSEANASELLEILKKRFHFTTYDHALHFIVLTLESIVSLNKQNYLFITHNIIGKINLNATHIFSTCQEGVF